jgi:hypothetical protein
VLGSEQVCWANSKIGPGAPPIKTSAGWLATFDAVTADKSKELPAWHKGWHKTYTIGIVLLDLESPWKVIGMSRDCGTYLRHGGQGEDHQGKPKFLPGCQKRLGRRAALRRALGDPSLNGQVTSITVRL